MGVHAHQPGLPRPQRQAEGGVELQVSPRGLGHSFEGYSTPYVMSIRICLEGGLKEWAVPVLDSWNYNVFTCYYDPYNVTLVGHPVLDHSLHIICMIWIIFYGF